jgi:hypothetical protein
MTAMRFGRLVVVVVALLQTAALPMPLEWAPLDGGWNITRATLVAESSVSPTQIALVRGIAVHDDISLRDGTIEADLDAPRASQFAGFAFRVASTADYEIVYFRGSGGQWKEVQYQPLFDGEPTWQLYSGPGYSADLPSDSAATAGPMHVKIVFADTRADVYINRAAQPALRIRELKRAPQAGHVAVWAAGDRTAQMTFANYSAVARVETQLEPLAPASPSPGQIMRWRVSARLASPDTINAPAELSQEHRQALRIAKTADAESDGLMNLSRIVGNPAGPQVENVFGGAGWGLALASVTLNVSQARTAILRFGYSEGISIFLNGRRVFAGTNLYSTPNLGRVVADANMVDLPLNVGANELVLAVTDRAFGWGFRARLDDQRGVTAIAPAP